MTSTDTPPSTASTVGDRTLSYAEYGDPDGTPVLFLHGTPGSRLLGSLFDADARDPGVRLIAPDRPGYGRSTPWPDRSIDDAETWVADLLDDAGVDSAGAVAFSGGSAPAIAAAAGLPDRIDRVDVVAGATPPRVSETTPTPQRVLSTLAGSTPRLLGGLFRGQAWLAARLDPSFVVGQYADDPDSLPERTAETLRADFLEAFAESRSGAVAEFRNTSTPWGIELARIESDLQFWHGDGDTNVPIEGVRRLVDELPAAELRVVDGADHARTLRRATPEALLAQAD